MALLEDLAVTWRSKILAWRHQPPRPLVEVHLVPAQPTARYGVLLLEQIATSLAALGRADGLFSPDQSVTVESNADAASAFSTDWRSGEGGLAVLRTGQRSCWFALPTVGLNSIVDREDMTQRVAERLHTLLAIGLPIPGRLAPAIGLDPVTPTTRLGRLVEASATSGSFSIGNPQRVRVNPEEHLSPEELRRANAAVAEELVARLAAPLRR
ncbi:hypothetical protein [Amycolatopsis kentuckyensis]|uniref:hypothetical protein n=1 Tax=Amycolatopsis kentuckyensis TaxID=218823 RepID=UPI00356595AF